MNIPELIAEGMGFGSGLLLLRPAFRVNGVLRDSAALRGILETSRSNLDRQTIPAILRALDEVSSSWDRWDDLCLKLGAGVFALSGLLKLFLVWARP